MLQDEDNHLHTHNLPKGCLTSLWSNPSNQIFGNFDCPNRNYWSVQLNRECTHKILPIENDQSIKANAVYLKKQDNSFKKASSQR